MIDAFNYANANRLPVKWHGKTIYMKTATTDHCPIIDTDVDFSGCTILMNSENNGQTIFKVGPNPESLLDAMTGKIINQSTCNTVFENYPNSMITVDSLHYLGKRFNREGTDTWYPHKQCFLTNSYGAIQPFDCYREISAYRGVYRIDKMSYPIKICFGKIVIQDGATASAEIKVQRANVTIENTSIIPNINQYININTAPFKIMYAYNVTMKNIIAINLPINSDKTVTSYIIDVHYSYKVTLENIIATKGWGAIATHFCTDVVMRNCHVGRADFHYGVYGVNIVEGCSFISYPCKIEIGYGDGTVIVRDCIFYKRVEGEIYSDVFIECRNDFAVMFSGKLIFENNTVQIYDHSTKKYSWLLTYRTYAFEDPLSWAPKNFPDVTIKNLVIRSEANSDEYDMLQLLGINNAYINKTYPLTVSHIEISCNSLDKQVRLITDFTNFDTTNAVMTLEKCFLDATGYYGTIYKDEETILTAPDAKIRNTYFDYNEMDTVNGALEVFDDTTDDNMEELIPKETVANYVMNLKTQSPYGPGEKYSYAVYDIDGDYPYLVSGHSTSNAANGNGALCAFYDINDNWIMSGGFDPFVKYANYRVVAPPNAVKLIVNLGAGAQFGYPIKAVKILTKCASAKLNRMQSVLDNVSQVMPNLIHIPEILDIEESQVIKTEITPDNFVTGSIYNLVAKTVWESGDSKYAYGVFPVIAGETYQVCGRSSSNAANGNGALCAFYDFSNALIDEPLGRDQEMQYTDYEVVAPENAVKLIVNRNKNVPLTVNHVVYQDARSRVINDVVESVESVKFMENIINVVNVPDEILDMEADELFPGTSYNLVSKNTWEGGDKYAYAIYSVSGGTKYYVTGSSGSRAESGNGALCAFYDNNNNLIDEPFGRTNNNIYTNYEVIAPSGSVKMIVNKTSASVTIGVKFLLKHPPYSATINDILSRLSYLETHGGGGGNVVTGFAITSFMSNPSFAEKGTTVTDVTLSYNINKPISELTLDESSVTANQSGTIELTGLSLTNDKTWQLSATSTSDETAINSASLIFVNKIFYGTSATPSAINSTFLLTLTGELSNIKSRTITVNALDGQYIWYAVPATLGTCSFKVGGFLGGFALVDTITHNSESYYIYRSSNFGLGNQTVEVI